MTNLSFLPDECIETSTSKDKDGYGKLNLGKKQFLAHRIAYSIFIGPIPQWAVIMHTCDNPSCCNPKHLVAGTQAENLADCKRKGRRPHPSNVKLTPEIVETIKTNEADVSSTFLAKKYGVSSGRIRQIRRGEGWKGVDKK